MDDSGGKLAERSQFFGLQKLLESLLQFVVSLAAFGSVSFGAFARFFQAVAKRAHHAADDVENHDFGVLIDCVIKIRVRPVRINVRRINDRREKLSGQPAAQPEQQRGGDNRKVIETLVNLVRENLIDRRQKMQNRYQND